MLPAVSCVARTRPANARHTPPPGLAFGEPERVERLFQILKATAQPIGLPWQTGAGLPDAARALGVESAQRPFTATLTAELAEMRNAIRQMNQIHLSASEVNLFEPLRGPANVTQLPLNQAPWTFVMEAIMLAGLSGGY